MIQAHYIQAHLLMWGPVPNRPGPVPVRRARRLGTPALEGSWSFIQLTGGDLKILHSKQEAKQEDM